MGESFFEKWINARIHHILQTSYYMKQDILHRHASDENSKDKVIPMEEKIPYHEDYSFGWKKIIEDAVIEYWVADGFIFTGPDGCGKHTAAELAFCALEKFHKDFFEFVFLPAKAFIFTPSEQKAYEEERTRLMEEGRTDAFTEDIVHYFFEHLFCQLPKRQGISLVIDNSEQLDIQAVYDRLGKYMCISQYEWREVDEAADEFDEETEEFEETMNELAEDVDTMPLVQNLFVIIIDKEDYNIPSLLYKKLLRIRMSYPTLEQRISLLKTMGLYNEIVDILAPRTENYNYTQLRHMAKNVQIFSIFDDDLNGVFYDEIVRSQLFFKPNEQIDFLRHQETSVPQIAAAAKESEQAAKESDQLTEEKIRLYQKIEQLIELLPEILEKIGTSVSIAAPQTVAVADQPQKEETLSLEQIQKKQEELMSQQPSEESIAQETANMEFRDLLGSTLGAERMSRIEANRN